LVEIVVTLFLVCIISFATGLAFNEEGRLFSAANGADERGSRPILNDWDKFYEVKLNGTLFYGWPDFFGNAQPVIDPRLQSKLHYNQEEEANH
jgi:glucose/arabinose dehydrogenase